ncbi:MAG: imidazoleglycerol-phosphate dehydratase HisB [Thaumarchaeota archaeon]|nr:imidazoleglycerol-phosphate dehydratase HisB [Nitrososphaerota archaeon]
MRKAKIVRKTKETYVSVNVSIDGTGDAKVKTGIKFLDHMVASLAKHSMIDIKLQGKGDLVHHLVEDVGITVGEALDKALGNRAGIARFGSAYVPMDDSIAYAAIDLVKRPYSVLELKIDKDSIEDIPAEDIYHFLQSLAMSLQANIHVIVQYGQNDHHKVEAGFKALAISLKQACAIDARRKGLPSLKGKM